MGDKKKIVIHACCAVCLGYPLELLKELGYEPFVLFYNPNIFPLEEYERRKQELVRLCEVTKTEYKIIDEDIAVFYDYVKGLETEPERGNRCTKCFELRLRKTAAYAKEISADCFTTTLSVSPHKVFAQIKQSAQVASVAFDIPYLEMDFKKQNGFLKTNEIARGYDFYRQTYCGCEFSKR